MRQNFELFYRCKIMIRDARRNVRVNIRTKTSDIVMGAHRIFARGGQWGGLNSEGRKSPAGAAPRWGSGAKSPEVDDIFSKWCINTSSTEVLTFAAKSTFQHSQGASAPLVHACGAHGYSSGEGRWEISSVKQLSSKIYWVGLASDGLIW